MTKRYFYQKPKKTVQVKKRRIGSYVIVTKTPVDKRKKELRKTYVKGKLKKLETRSQSTVKMYPKAKGSYFPAFREKRKWKQVKRK